jgi:hypothetical protein
VHPLRLGRHIDALRVGVKPLRNLGHPPECSIGGSLGLRPVAKAAAHAAFEPSSEKQHSTSPTAGRADEPKPPAANARRRLREVDRGLNGSTVTTLVPKHDVVACRDGALTLELRKFDPLKRVGDWSPAAPPS